MTVQIWKRIQMSTHFTHLWLCLMRIVYHKISVLWTRNKPENLIIKLVDAGYHCFSDTFRFSEKDPTLQPAGPWYAVRRAPTKLFQLLQQWRWWREQWETSEDATIAIFTQVSGADDDEKSLQWPLVEWWGRLRAAASLPLSDRTTLGLRIISITLHHEVKNINNLYF